MANKNTEVGKQRLRIALLLLVVGWGGVVLSNAGTVPAEVGIVLALVGIAGVVMILLAILAFLRPSPDQG